MHQLQRFIRIIESHGIKYREFQAQDILTIFFCSGCPYPLGSFSINRLTREITIRHFWTQEKRPDYDPQQMVVVLSHEFSHFYQWREGEIRFPIPDTGTRERLNIEVDAWDRAERFLSDNNFDINRELFGKMRTYFLESYKIR